jgi:hypothetical protein
MSGWKGYTGGIGMMLVGVGLIWYSTHPSCPDTARPQLLAAGLALIPAGLAALGIRAKQEEVHQALKDAGVVDDPKAPLAAHSRGSGLMIEREARRIRNAIIRAIQEPAVQAEIRRKVEVEIDFLPIYGEASGCIVDVKPAGARVEKFRIGVKRIR